MKHSEVENNIGKQVTLNGDRDLGMDGDLRKLIYNKTVLTIVKLTRGGLVHLTDGKRFYTVRSGNIDLLEE